MLNVNKILACIFDIEGTTTPISFVHEVLFPYSAKNMENFLDENSLESEIILELSEENKADIKSKLFEKEILSSDDTIDKKNLLEYLLFLIVKDRKSKPLKTIQGRIWKMGYERSELKSILFPDVKEFFQQLDIRNIKIYIYSSGSIEAQKLIFKYSNYGDLTEYITDYFDTKIGAKRESSSYASILKAIDIDPKYVAFYTDIKEEADAATQNKIKCFIMKRPGNSPQIMHAYEKIESFL
jgi:enolase-phosphatase E1